MENCRLFSKLQTSELEYDIMLCTKVQRFFRQCISVKNPGIIINFMSVFRTLRGTYQKHAISIIESKSSNAMSTK